MSEILKVKDLSVKNGKFILSNLSFELEAGFIYGLMGENGAGKSTLLKALTNYDCAYTGEVLFEGEDLQGQHGSCMERIGFISEDREFFELLSGRENAGIFGPMYKKFDMNRFEEYAKKMDLSVNKKYGSLSRGEKIKFQLALEIAHCPSLYILDEATAGMDPVFKKDLFGILHQLMEDENTAILMTSQIESDMKRHVDYVALLRNGQLGAFTAGIDL